MIGIDSSCWKRVPLGDTARFINGAAFKPSDWADDGLPIIRIQNLTGTGESFNRTNRVVKPDLVVEPGDLLVSWSATLDAYRWSGPRGVLNQHIFKVLPKEGVRPDYLYYALREVIAELETKTHGSTMKHVVRGDFESTRIPLPSIAEQDRIVELLARAENIVRMRREAEAKAKEIIPALFLDMFGDLESNNRRWKVRNLAEVTFFQEGPGIMAVDFRETGVPLVRLSGLQGSRVSLSGCNYLDEAKVSKRWSQFRLAKEDILVLTSATFGNPAVVDSEAEGAIFYTGIIRFRPLIDSLSRTYLRAFLGSPFFLQQARKLASGSVIKHFGPSHLRQMLIPIPSLEAQERFGEYLPEAERIVSEQSSARLLAQEIFQSLLAGVFEEGNA
jgi:type I restriction enzyme S subunit